MDKKLELYYFDSCPFCQLVLRKIKSIENAQKHITLKDILTDQKYLQEHIDKTGRRTVPCLYIDNKPMFESQDIVSWLETNKEIFKE